MKEDIKKLWIEELRSGNYEQGTGALKNSVNEYCCLGVLCEIYKAQTGKGKWEESEWSSTINFVAAFDDLHSEVLPTAVIDWSGLEDANPTITQGSECETLAEYNDQDNSFDEIADLIEKYL